MAAPVTLAELKALLPSPTANECDAFAKALLANPAMYYKLWSYIFDASGNVRAEFLSGAAAGGSVVLTPGMYIHDASTSLDEWTNGSGIKGRILCDGASYLRSDYAALFAKVGTTYGAADGTHFNVPDARGRCLVGIGQTTDVQPTPETRTITLNERSGEFNHTLLRVELPTDMFGSNVTGAFVRVSSGGSFVNGGAGTSYADRAWQGTSTPMNNMQPFIGGRIYIKS